MSLIQHEQILDNLSDGITIQDREFNIIYQNKAMQDAFGSLLGRKCYEAYERRDEVCEGCGVRKAFETGRVQIVLRTAFEKDGSTSYWENSCIPLFDDKGNITAGVELCRNIKERVSLEAEVKERNIELGQLNKELKRKAELLLSALAEREAAEKSLRLEVEQRRKAEEELRESEEKYRMQFDNSLDAIILADSESGVLIDCNAAAQRLLGRDASEIIGSHQKKIHPPDAIKDEFSTTFAQHLGERNGEILETQIITGSGEIRDVAVKANSFELRGRQVMQGTFRDITEQKKAENERAMLEAMLLHAQKLESVGQLAAGIAHEINTPIQFIGDNTRFLSQSLSNIKILIGKYEKLHNACRADENAVDLLSDIESAINELDMEYTLEELPKAIEQTLEGIERVSGIVRSIKEFSHPQGKEMAYADLNRAIQNTVTISRNEWKYYADLSSDLDPDLPRIPCFLDDINQVILNLIINAAQSITGKERGKIIVVTRYAPPWAEISISDNGCGIPDAVRDRIFNPFFTTKEVGKGTGLGLAISHSVITKKHGGTITFESEVGKGTTFLIRIPIEKAQI